MQTFKTFLYITIFITIAYSCEPEELPEDLPVATEQTDSQIPPNDGTDTGDDDDEYGGSGGE